MKKTGLIFFILCIFTALTFAGGEIHYADKGKIPSWKALGPSGGIIRCMTYNPKNNKELYAVVGLEWSGSGSVFKSTNSGKSWTRVGVLDDTLFGIAVDPKNPSTVYVAGSYNLFKSENGGKTWKSYYYEVSSSSDSANEYIFGTGNIAIDPKNPNNIYVAGRCYQQNTYKNSMALLKSSDGGETWQIAKVGSGNPSASGLCVAVNPSNPSVIYFGGYYYNNSYNYRIYKSTNSGNSWTNITGIINTKPYEIAIDSKNPSKVYVATGGGVYRSTNSGQTWVKNQGSVYPTSVTIDPSNSDILYAGRQYSSMIYKSVDGGINWSEYKEGLHGFPSTIIIPSSGSASYQDMFFIQGNPLYCGTSRGVYYSSNGGINWSSRNSSLKGAFISNMTVSSKNPKVIYISVEQDGLYKSTSGGKKWARLPNVPGCEKIKNILVDQDNPNRLFILVGG